MTKSIKSLLTIAFLASTLFLSAQTTTGKFSVSAGIGVVPTFLNDDASVNTPPLSIRIAYQVSPIFQLGGYAGYSSATSNTPFIISDGQSSVISSKQVMLGLRGEVRKDISEKFDVYGGAMLGYQHQSTREYDRFTNQEIVRNNNAPTPYNPNQPTGQILYSGFVGTTYYFNNNIGVFAEAGYGVSLLNTGITVRL